MQETSYFSHAWALLTKDKGWFKVIVMLTLWMLIPIVGWLWVLGYEVEWARLIAWGAEGSPKQKNIDLGQCLVSGWRAFVAQFGWGILWTICYYLILMVSGAAYFYRFYPFVEMNFGSPVLLLVDVAGVFYGILLVVAGVRTAIYQSCAAGFQLNRIFDMLKRDISGFVRVVGINLLSIIVSGMVIGMLSFFAGLLAVLGVGLLSYGAVFRTYNVGAVFFVLLALLLYFLVVGMIALVVTLIAHAMVGLWLRQFDVLSWGASGDPLPGSPRLGQGNMTVQPGEQGQTQSQQFGGQGQTQPQQQASAMNSPGVMTPPPDMGQKGPAPIAPVPDPTPVTSVPPTVPYPAPVPFGSPTATPAPTTEDGVAPSSNAERVDVTPLSGTPLSQGQDRLDELASPVESISLDGDDLMQQSSQTTDAKGFQELGRANDETSSQVTGQESSHSKPRGEASASDQA